METKAKNNGQAIVNTVKADKTPKFVAGNPVNEVSKADETKADKKRNQIPIGTGKTRFEF